MVPRRLWICLFGSAALAVTCGEPRETVETPEAEASGEERPPAGALDACALLTPAEVEEALGVPVRDSTAMQMPGLSVCNYASATDPAVVTLMARPGSPYTATARDQVRQTLVESGVEPQDVPGLGEAAVWGGNQLHVFRSDGPSVAVSVSGDAGLETAVELARRALE